MTDLPVCITTNVLTKAHFIEHKVFCISLLKEVKEILQEKNSS